MSESETKLRETKRTRWLVLALLLALAAAAFLKPGSPGLSRNVREKVAVRMGKNVSSLTEADLAGVTSIELQDYERPYLTLPKALSRWQHHLPKRKITITDTDLEGLDQLHALQWLGLNETLVTDAGLAHLAKHPALKQLCLGETQVTDAGLVHLAKLPALQVLYIGGTPITEAGAERFKEERKQAGLPKCMIVR